MILFVRGPREGLVEYIPESKTEVTYPHQGKYVKYRVYHQEGLALLSQDPQGNRVFWRMITSTIRSANQASDILDLTDYLIKSQGVHPDTIRLTRQEGRLVATGFKPLKLEGSHSLAQKGAPK